MNTGWVRAAVAAVAVGLLAPASQAVVLDDFTGTTLDTAIWNQLGPKTYTMSGGLLTWNEDSGDWGKGEIATVEAYFLPPAGETSTVTWVMGPAAVTTDNGDRSVRIQMGLISGNETADTREHWANSTGGIWLDGPELLTASNTQVGIELFAANDTKTYGDNATLVGGMYRQPWNWTTETAVFRVDITSETFTWYHNGTALATNSFAEQGIDSEFANGFHIWVMGQNNSDGRGSASVDQIEIDNPITGPGLISSFLGDPPNVIGGVTTTLRFEVDPAATVTIAPDIGAVSHVGGVGSVDVLTEIVDAATTTVYILTATVGAVEETREATITSFPIPDFELANFADEFDGDALDTEFWTVRSGNRPVSETNGLLVVWAAGENWGHGQVATEPAYKIPGPEESTEITWELGPSTITSDPGGQALRLQVGIVSGDESDGWSLEHYKNTTGGVWLDLDTIQTADTNSMSGSIFTADDTKATDNNGTSLTGVTIDEWNWQAENRTVTLQLTDSGFNWYDGDSVLGGSSWDATGLDSEFFSGYRIVAIAMNYAAGRGENSFDAIRAVSLSGDFGLTEIVQVAGGVELAWEVESGATYTVQRADMLDGTWNTLPGGSDLSSDTNRYTDATPAAASAFYQMVKTPPPPLFEAGFEPGEDLSGWTEVSYLATPLPVWGVGAPTVGPPAAHTGVNLYGTVLDGTYSGFDEVGLQTPLIDLTGVTRATLRFYQWHAFPPDDIDTDEARVRIFNEGGNLVVDNPIATYTGSTDGWELAEVPLPTEATGQRIRIEFYLFSDIDTTAAGWYIDDVEVK